MNCGICLHRLSSSSSRPAGPDLSQGSARTTPANEHWHTFQTTQACSLYFQGGTCPALPCPHIDGHVSRGVGSALHPDTPLSSPGPRLHPWFPGHSTPWRQGCRIKLMISPDGRKESRGRRRAGEKDTQPILPS